MKNSIIAKTGSPISQETLAKWLANQCPLSDYVNQKVLLIIPDNTRTAPVGLIFKTIFEHLTGTISKLDLLIALGTHQPMNEEAICKRIEISLDERKSRYQSVGFFNHQWDKPDALRQVGVLSKDQIDELTQGRFAMEVPVEVNRRLYDYDCILILSPVFPHEVAGFSGGNKYLFPGVSGPRLLHFFHWLAAIITNPKIIGHKQTAVRRVIDAASALVDLPKQAFCMVVRDGALGAIFGGTPESAWEGAAEISRQWHITYKERAFHTILSCAPPMYEELWVGGKCMYKLEPVLADGGELIIYAPHIREVSRTHGALIERLGFHCRDYFLKQWDRFKDYPWGVLAHCTQVYGQGIFENGVEMPRAKVTLATGLSPDQCAQLNLAYRDPASIDVASFSNREEEGILLVPKAGEQLFALKSSSKVCQ